MSNCQECPEYESQRDMKHRARVQRDSITEKYNKQQTLLELIYNDLLIRAEEVDGVKVVDLSGFIWDKLKKEIGK